MVKMDDCTDERCGFDFDKHEYLCYCGTYQDNPWIKGGPNVGKLVRLSTQTAIEGKE